MYLSATTGYVSSKLMQKTGQAVKTSQSFSNLNFWKIKKGFEHSVLLP